MSAYNGNNPYLTIDGISVAPQFMTVQIDPAVEKVEVTAGAGRAHKQRAEGLYSHKISLKLAYDITNTPLPPVLLPLLRGRHRVIWGPEGSATGKPKHDQYFILDGAKRGQDVKKKDVILDVSGESADDPLTDMDAGGTF